MKIKNRAEKELAKNVRWQALKIIYQIEYESGFSNQLINQFLNQSILNEADNRLLVQLVYGVVQNRYTIDFYLQAVIEGKKIEPWLLSLLRLSVYQLVYLNRIPAFAVVNEAVKIAKANGHQGLGNFVNALLRNFQRMEKPNFDQIQDPFERLSIKYSVQKWIVEDLLKQFEASVPRVEKLLSSLLEEPFVSARINSHPEKRDEFIKQLADEGFDVDISPLSPYGIRCYSGNLVHSTLFAQGLLTIQDESSMLVAPVGNIQGDETILDACAAPGGKATHIAQLLTGGHLTALDLSKAKLQKAKDHAERMNLSEKIDFHVADATLFQPNTNQLYDMIYLDAPCSGLGLMRRKPEIKYEKKPTDVSELVSIQLELLNHLDSLLKNDGTLVYSTCSTTRQENEEVIAQFIATHVHYRVEPIGMTDQIPSNLITNEGYIRVWQDQYHTDGFFICRLRKREKM